MTIFMLSAAYMRNLRTTTTTTVTMTTTTAYENLYSYNRRMLPVFDHLFRYSDDIIVKNGHCSQRITSVV